MSAARSASYTGILCALTAWFTFSLNDVGIKFLSGDYALHQIVLVRSTIGLLLTLAILVPLEGGYANLKTSVPLLHITRGLCVVIANMCFFVSLASLELPVATAIFFVAPLFITALSVVVLGEQVGPRRWIAVMVGLLGVVIMLRPGTSSFVWAALLPLLAAAAYATLQMLTRKIGFRDKASTMSFYIQLVFVVVCSLFGLIAGDGEMAGGNNPSTDFLLRAWRWPVLIDWVIMIGLGVATAFGGYLISQAYRMSEAAVIAPFEYLAVLLALFWGAVIFDETPDLVSWIGIALILSSGLYVFWREVVLERRVAIAHPMPRNR